jgi:SpoVK/Ycf46/Vps4 family AAA+-type ATPase
MWVNYFNFQKKQFEISGENMRRRRIRSGGTGDLLQKQESFVFWKRIEYLINFLKRPEGKLYDETITFIALLARQKERKELLSVSQSALNEVTWGSDRETEEFIEHLESIGRKHKYSRIIRKKVVTLLESKRKPAETAKKKFIKNKLDELQKVFSLTDNEVEILLIVYLSTNDDAFENLFSEYNHRGDALKRIILINLITNIKVPQLRKLFTAQAPLRRFGLLDNDIDMEDHLNEFLSGLNNESLSSEYFALCKPGKIPIEEHEHVSKDMEILKPLILNRRKGEALNILIYGPPGTGKTELCKSMANEFSMKLYQVKQKSDTKNNNSTSFRFTALNACMNCIDTEKSIILIDEADEMLNGSGGMFMFSRNTEKGVVNDIIDNSNAICIWITNVAGYIDTSTRRRFDYSIEFQNLTASRRRKMWKSCIAKARLKRVFSDKNIEQLSEEYEINTGGITLALKNYKKIARDLPAGKTPMETIESVIESHLQVMTFGRSKKKKVRFNRDKYCVEALSYKSTVSLEDSLAMLKQFYNALYEKKNSDMYVQNMNFLMYGPPGTGKTEFVKYMAQHIGCKVIEKNGSNLLDKYVGGTEKNIRIAFQEAEEEKAILFIDEADGLIGERSGAQRSWEITQVNEFLRQMEDFRGILVCATNFKKNLDAAAIRRFSLKIEFDYLKDAGKEILYNRLLAPMVKGKRTNEERKYLKNIKFLTPGDFKVVIQKFSFFPPEKITHTFLLDTLKEEVESKNNISTRQIGFL